MIGYVKNIFAPRSGLGDDLPDVPEASAPQEMVEAMNPPASQAETTPVPESGTGLWSKFLTAVSSTVPTIVTEVPSAYKAYETSGGGVKGTEAALTAFGGPIPGTQPPPELPPVGKKFVPAPQAASSGLGKGSLLIGALAVGAAVLLLRKKR